LPVFTVVTGSRSITCTSSVSASGQCSTPLVLGLVMVPDELAAQLDDLHVHVVDAADDLRRPALREARELVGEVHDLHDVDYT
jgi:hypothetical protein